MKLLSGSLIVFLCILSLFGCSATKTLIWTDPDINFTNFKAFEIRPVYYAPHIYLNQDILLQMTENLKSEFEKQGLHLNNEPQTKIGILIVECLISAYSINLLNSGIGRGSPTRKARCLLNTRLVDKAKGTPVAEIVTITEFGVDFIGKKTQDLLLEKSASTVVKEVAKIMQH